MSSTYVLQTQSRQWVVSIPSNTFSTWSISTQDNASHVVYDNHYGINFKKNNQTLYQLSYEFKVSVEKGTLVTLVTNFQQFQFQSPFSYYYCNKEDQCITEFQCQLYLCTTSNCDNPLDTFQLILHQPCWLYVNITQPGFSKYKLTSPIVSQFNYFGQTIYTIMDLPIDFAYDNFYIIVETQLEGPKPKSTKLQKSIESHFIKMTAVSETISCIRNSSRQCLSCSEKCTAKYGAMIFGFPENCVEGNQIVIATLFLGLIM